MAARPVLHRSSGGLRALWGPIVGPIVAILSFVCSIGNVPLAAALWNGGISVGGVVAFLLGDLLMLPILNNYRRYYGPPMALVLLGAFLILATVLVMRFVRTGGIAMLGMMGGPPDTAAEHDHSGHTGHPHI